MPTNGRKPEKYYKFTATQDGFIREAYICSIQDFINGTLTLLPDGQADEKKPVLIQAFWLGTPHKNILWDTDPDQFTAYAKILDSASRTAVKARDEAVAAQAVLDQVRSAKPDEPDDPSEPPAVYMDIPDGSGAPVRFALPEILKAMGIQEMPGQVRFGISRNGLDMYAEIEPGEAQYPGITIDAQDKSSGLVWLGNFEMPNETYPHRISARLYAGCAAYENDQPIAVVTHDVTDSALFAMRTARYGKSEAAKPLKLVYVDTKHALSRHWDDAGEDAMPEHREDEDE